MATPSKDPDFTLDDFRNHLGQLKKMGPMRDLMEQTPGMREMIPEGEDPEEEFRRIEKMLDAMTEEERRTPDLIDQERRQRIAEGSGTEPHEVEQFLGQFEEIRRLLRRMAKMSIWQRIKMMVLGFGKLEGDAGTEDDEED